MAFYESPRFPDNISRGSSGGPRWSTDVVIMQSGHEQRNERWENARHEYNVAYGVKDIVHLEALKQFFMFVRGQAHGFRYKDWADYRSGAVQAAPTMLDQQIGIGDGVQTDFQLVKIYDNYTREIKKPVGGTILVAVDGNPVVPSGIDLTTGIVTITPAPSNGLAVTAGYEFDVPCAFATDVLMTQMDVYYLGSADVPLVELRL